MNNSLIEKKYATILADPPWNFKNYSKKGEGRNAKAHYDCMSFEDIAKIDVASMAAKDCVLFLWATDPMLPKALELITAWGFEFKTVAFYWAKTNKNANRKALSEADFFTGLGYWSRANCEICILATRGAPRRINRDVRKLIVSPRREHSRKPDEIYERVERLVSGPYLEMFSRQSRPGWDSWGDQTGLFDEGHAPTRRRPSRRNLTPELPGLVAEGAE